MHTSPHLAPALDLDTAMVEFSTKLASRGLPTRITSSADLDALMNAFTSDVDALRLWEYYVINVEASKAALRNSFSSSSSIPEWTGERVEGRPVAELANVVRAAGKLDGLSTYAKRFGVNVEPAFAASLTKAAFTNLGNDVDALSEAWGRVVDVLNVDLYTEANDDKKAALDGIRNRVQYTRLDAHGPKLGEITAK